MRFTDRSRSLFLATAVLLFAGCADPSRQLPVEPAAGNLVLPVVGNVGLLSCAPLPYDSVTQVIGPDGGVLRVGPHTFTVPPGSLDSLVAITAVTPTGNVNLVRFRPEGLKFGEAARLTISYANCDLLGSLLPRRVAYIDGDLGILDYLWSLDDFASRSVTGTIKHFSDYAVAW